MEKFSKYQINKNFECHNLILEMVFLYITHIQYHYFILRVSH